MGDFIRVFDESNRKGFDCKFQWNPRNDNRSKIETGLFSELRCLDGAWNTLALTEREDVVFFFFFEQFFNHCGNRNGNYTVFGTTFA